PYKRSALRAPQQPLFYIPYHLTQSFTPKIQRSNYTRKPIMLCRPVFLAFVGLANIAYTMPLEKHQARHGATQPIGIIHEAPVLDESAEDGLMTRQEDIILEAPVLDEAHEDSVATRQTQPITIFHEAPVLEESEEEDLAVRQTQPISIIHEAPVLDEADE
ncbi:hypothetical protein F4780DRAFT_442764, partial [Xylariomycetidae sp. FL0641]